MTTPTIRPVPAKADRAAPHRRTASEVRTLVRHRDGYRCRLCGMTARDHFRKYNKKLDVHRLTPGSRYTLRGCITVCRSCHGPLPRSERSRSGSSPRCVAFDLDIWQAVQLMALRQCRSVGGQVRYIMIQALRAEGVWPPTPELFAELERLQADA